MHVPQVQGVRQAGGESGRTKAGFLVTNSNPSSQLQLLFTCIIPHTHFFTYILMFAFSINLLYITVLIYTLIWIAFKDCRKLSSHLTIYSKMCREREMTTMEKEGAEVMERRIDVFGGLNSPDICLLLDLLAETMGMAPAMRIMTMLDPELLKSWKVKRRIEVILDWKSKSLLL